MTCIVGLIQDEHIWMGGDRVSSDGTGRLTSMAQPKIVEKSNDQGDSMVIGLAGMVRDLDLIRHSLTVPKREEGQDVPSYMVTTFADAMRATLKKGGSLLAKDGIEVMYSNLLIGYDHRLWVMGGNFAVLESADPYESIGSGVKYALGSLHSTDGLEPQERLERSLKSAEYFSDGVRGPFDYLEL